jgi:hypothetical protein
MKKIPFVGLMLAFILAGCRTFEEGPELSFRPLGARLMGTWRIQNYHIEGIDYGARYADIRLRFSEDNIFNMEGDIHPYRKAVWEFKRQPNDNGIIPPITDIQIRYYGNGDSTDFYTRTFRIIELSYKKIQLYTHGSNPFYADSILQGTVTRGTRKELTLVRVD